MKDMDFTLNKREFWDAVKLHYDWPIPECPSIYVCGTNFSVDHAVVSKCGGFVIQWHNELHDLEAELLEMVCSDVQIEPSLQPVTWEKLNRGANKENGARLDFHVRDFWKDRDPPFFMYKGMFTQTRTSTERWPHSKFTSSMKQKRRGNIHHG